MLRPRNYIRPLRSLLEYTSQQRYHASFVVRARTIEARCPRDWQSQAGDQSQCHLENYDQRNGSSMILGAARRLSLLTLAAGVFIIRSRTSINSGGRVVEAS